MPKGTLPFSASPAWSYREAFARHVGLITEAEQERLRRSRAAVIGLGGVGGIHLVTLARLGIGSFTIADPDRFEAANINRQHGATSRTLGLSKAEVMSEEVLAINPEIRLRTFREGITVANVDEILDDVDVVLDGIDFFALDSRRLLFRAARERGIWVITAGPLGFSTAWLVFSPHGMSFDEYFDLEGVSEPVEQLASFLLGLAPRATHRTYLDLSQADPATGRGPSSALACQLCAGVAAAEVVKIVLGRGPIRPAPWAFQFDAYRHRFEAVRLSRYGRRLRRFRQQRLQNSLVRMGWRPPTNGGTASLMEQLVRAASSAPSGGNTQPWRFVVDEESYRIAIQLDETRDPSPMNAGGRLARIAVGAALENMLQAARERELGAELEPASPGTIAVVRLSGEPKSPGRELIAARTTNRRLYDGRAVPQGVLERLRDATPEVEGLRTCWVVDLELLLMLADVIGRADELLFTEPRMRRAFLSSLRLDAPAGAAVEERLSVASLELPGAGRLAIRLLRYLPDLLHVVAAAFGARARAAVASASGLCLVTAPDRTPAADVSIGRVAQRAWLALTGLGMVAQPMMSLPVLVNAVEHGEPAVRRVLGPERVAALEAAFVDLVPELGGGRPAWVMRFGFARPTSGRTGRRPLGNVCSYRSLQPGRSP